ncbi:MAG: transcription termination factor Rho [Myxococcales bacterium]|nr:transcription termination factor Rho [Myxococcales bacterium]
MPVDFPTLHETPLEELRKQARALGVSAPDHIRRADLVFEVGRIQGDREGQRYGRGVLEVLGEGFGFLRSPADNFLSGGDDIYVSQSQIRRFKLRTGDTVVGQIRPPKEGERYPAMLRVESVNGEPPGVDTPSFDALTAIYPDDRIELKTTERLRAIDLAAPLGLGQRGILVAPPGTGRVELLRELAEALTRDDELFVTVLLLGERPEEIHEWRNHSRAEVIATPFDEPPARHVQVADIAFERARRMAERGDDAVLLVDSLSRLLRFCLAELPPSGRSIGGVDSASIHRVRRYMGAARALEEGGSLTVVGVLTGEQNGLLEDLRDVVNWQLHLDPQLGGRGIRPPIQVHLSGTRRVERLLEPAEIDARSTWRATLTGDPLEDAEKLLLEARRA